MLLVISCQNKISSPLGNLWRNCPPKRISLSSSDPAASWILLSIIHWLVCRSMLAIKLEILVALPLLLCCSRDFCYDEMRKSCFRWVDFRPSSWRSWNYVTSLNFIIVFCVLQLTVPHRRIGWFWFLLVRSRNYGVLASEAHPPRLWMRV